jgi:hypothetical protein
LFAQHVISDSDHEIEEPDTKTSRSKRNTTKKSSQDNSFKKFGFAVTDKKTAIASMSSSKSSGDKASSSRSKKNTRSTSTKRAGQSSSTSRRSQRSTSSVNYAEPNSEDDNKDESSDGEDEGSDNQSQSHSDSEGDSVEEVSAPKARPTRATKAAITNKKRGTKAGASDSLASLPLQDTVSSRRRSAAAKEQGLPSRTISYADLGSDDEMFLLTGSEDEGKGSKKSKRKSVGGGRAAKDTSRNTPETGNNSDDEDSNGSDGAGSDESGSGSGSDDNDGGFKYKIQYILGSETHTAAEWVPICQAIDTREVTRGSVWQQSDDEFFSTSSAPITKYLIKWNHASYLHVSWEAEHDLVNMVGNAAKTQIKRFKQTAVNGVAAAVFDDLRLGEYFPPNYLTIDRILDIDDEKVEMTTVEWAEAPLPPRDLCDKAEEVEEAAAGEEAVADASAEQEEAPEDMEEADEEEANFNSSVVHKPEAEEEDEEGRGEGARDAMKEEAEPPSSPPRRRASSRTASAVARLMLADMVEKPSPERAHRSKKQTRKEAAQSRQRQRSGEEGGTKKKTAKKAAVYPYLHSGTCFVTVKWDNMPYAETSFEDVNDLIKYQIDYEKPLRMFYQREQSTPAKNSRRNFKRKLEAELLKSDTGPEFQVGELRDYQWTGVRWLLFSWSQRRNTILADEMGLGK